MVGDKVEYLLGALFLLIFLIIGVGCGYVGYRLGIKNKHNTPEISEEEKRNKEKLDKYFRDIFSYDIDTALKRKRVRDE